MGVRRRRRGRVGASTAAKKTSCTLEKRDGGQKKRGLRGGECGEKEGAGVLRRAEGQTQCVGGGGAIRHGDQWCYGGTQRRTHSTFNPAQLAHQSPPITDRWEGVLNHKRIRTGGEGGSHLWPHLTLLQSPAFTTCTASIALVFQQFSLFLFPVYYEVHFRKWLFWVALLTTSEAQNFLFQSLQGSYCFVFLVCTFMFCFLATLLICFGDLCTLCFDVFLLFRFALATTSIFLQYSNIIKFSLFALCFLFLW